MRTNQEPHSCERGDRANATEELEALLRILPVAFPLATDSSALLYIKLTYVQRPDIRLLAAGGQM
jgi:hypothetical protein